MRDTLIELFTWLFQRDNQAIEHIEKNFDKHNAGSFTKPPENVASFVDALQMFEGVEVVDGIHHLEEHKSNGMLIPKHSIEFMFKFTDVRLKRRKIYRLGDYYLRLINTGFDKWSWRFYMKMPGITLEADDIIEDFVLTEHPHISQGGACLAQMETPIRASITNYNLQGFLFRMGTFLSSWNYRSPHHEPERFENLHMATFNNSEGFKVMFSIADNHDCANIELGNYRLARDFPEIVGKTPLKLVSARKKDYEPEPISRTLHQAFCGLRYLDGGIMQFSSHHGFSKTVYHNLSIWLMSITKEDISYSKSLVLSRYLISKIREQCLTNSSELVGEWTAEYAKLSADLYNTTQVDVHFYKTIVHKGNNNYKDIKSHLWYLGNTRDNPESGHEAEELLRELSDYRNQLDNWRDILTDDSDSPSFSRIKTRVFQELDELCNADITFDKANNMLMFIRDYQVINENTPPNIIDKVAVVKKQFSIIKAKLNALYTRQIINHHEIELRRLKKDDRTKSAMQIKNLNL